MNKSKMITLALCTLVLTAACKGPTPESEIDEKESGEATEQTDTTNTTDGNSNDSTTGTNTDSSNGSATDAAPETTKLTWGSSGWGGKTVWTDSTSVAN